MILYHFTSLEYLPSIMEHGLNRGDVPTTMDDGLNGVWFTTQSDASGHGLNNRLMDKRAVRIKVVIPSHDRKLKCWMPWAQKRLEKTWFNALVITGGGTKKAESWYVYFGTVTPDMFREVLKLKED